MMKEIKIKRFVPLHDEGKELMDIIYGRLSLLTGEQKKIAVTSVLAGEGKTYITMQLARTFATKGYSVVIVDADLRWSQMIEQYHMVADKKIAGITKYLSGDCLLEDVIYKSNISELSIIPCNEYTKDPISLLSHVRFSEMLDILSEEFDFVLIDTPPMGINMDAVKIAEKCDGILLVVQYNKTHRKDLRQIKEKLNLINKPVIGTIINNVNFKSVGSRKNYRMIRLLQKRLK